MYLYSNLLGWLTEFHYFYCFSLGRWDSMAWCTPGNSRANPVTRRKSNWGGRYNFIFILWQHLLPPSLEIVFNAGLYPLFFLWARALFFILHQKWTCPWWDQILNDWKILLRMRKPYGIWTVNKIINKNSIIYIEFLLWLNPKRSTSML